MAERICGRCGQPEFSHPVSPELQCEKFVAPEKPVPLEEKLKGLPPAVVVCDGPLPF